jgi:guanylate kinase
MPSQDARPLLVVLSGPSGGGKGTALSQLTACGFVRVPTYTTRAPRPGERDGVHYRVVDDEEFMKRVAAGDIVEYTRTYNDSLYGAPRELFETAREEALLAELDVKGFARLRSLSRRRVVGVFVTAPTVDLAAERITERGEEDNLERRLEVHDTQLDHSWWYDYFVVNDDIDGFRERVGMIGRVELARTQGARYLAQRWMEMDATLSGQEAGSIGGIAKDDPAI